MGQERLSSQTILEAENTKTKYNIDYIVRGSIVA
jgi:hypothetical protein